MLRKLMRITAVVVMSAVITACGDKTQLDPGFGIDQGTSGVGGEFEPIIDQPVVGEETGLGGVPAMIDSAFIPLPDELQIWPNVYFANGQYVIGTAATQKLDKLAEYLIANPNYSIAIEGHCSITGSAEFNRVLSEKRALVAQDHLINKGVNPNNINTVAYGKERPAVQGNTEAAHAKNRRDVFIIGTKK